MPHNIHLPSHYSCLTASSIFLQEKKKQNYICGIFYTKRQIKKTNKYRGDNLEMSERGEKWANKRCRRNLKIACCSFGRFTPPPPHPHLLSVVVRKLTNTHKRCRSVNNLSATLNNLVCISHHWFKNGRFVPSAFIIIPPCTRTAHPSLPRATFTLSYTS